MVISTFWLIVVLIGGLGLGGAMAWAKLYNRTTPEQDRRTEQATHDLYEDRTTEDSSTRR